MSEHSAFDRLDPAYRRFADLPDAERIAWIRADRWIGFDQAGKAFARLDNLLTYPPRDRMPCLLIYGDVRHCARTNGASMAHHGQDQDRA